MIKYKQNNEYCFSDVYEFYKNMVDVKNLNPKIEVDEDNYNKILKQIPEFLPNITDESHLGTVAGIKIYKHE